MNKLKALSFMYILRLPKTKHNTIEGIIKQ